MTSKLAKKALDAHLYRARCEAAAKAGRPVPPCPPGVTPFRVNKIREAARAFDSIAMGTLKAAAVVFGLVALMVLVRSL